MCWFIIPMAIAAASAMQQQQGQQAQRKAQELSANMNYAQKYNYVERAGAQLGEQQSEQNLTNSLKAAQSFGTIAASASSLGLGGYSLSNLFGADATAGQRTQAITDANFAGKRQTLGTDLTGALIQKTSEYNSAEAADGGTTALVLGLGKAVGSGFNSYMSTSGKF